jgi:Protein of unknown function (DUF3788)
VDIPNAFIGQPAKPPLAELSSALGASHRLWEELVAWLAEEHGVAIQEWKSISPKYGWSLRLKRKQRTIAHLSPCNGFFLVSFALGDKALKSALQLALPKSVADDLASAPRYAEGTGVRLLIKRPQDLATVRKLVLVKLSN